MNQITPEHIRNVMEQSKYQDVKMGSKTTVVCCILPNGFELIVSSGCVDPDNYDHKIGIDICLKKIEDKLWELEGYLLQEKLNDV